MNIETYLLIGGLAVAILQLVRRQNKEIKNMSLATENLALAIASLTGSVDAAVAALGTLGVPEADVQLAADQIAAQADRLKAAVVPPVV